MDTIFKKVAAAIPRGSNISSCARRDAAERRLARPACGRGAPLRASREGQGGLHHPIITPPGSKANINEKFLGLTSNGGGSRVPFLPCFLDSSDPSWKNIGVQDLPSWLGKYFCSFEDGYGTEIPKVFRTRLIRAAHSDGFSAMLWRVDSGVGQRSTFRAKDHWNAVSVPLVEGDDE
jgi:hypothetical protein